MWDLSSLSRDWNCALQWKHGALTIGLSGSSLRYRAKDSKLVSISVNFKMCVCRYKPPNDHQIKLRTFSALQQALWYPFLIILPNSNHYSDVNRHLLVFACAWPLSICGHEKYTLSCLSFFVAYYMLWDLSILLHALGVWCFFIFLLSHTPLCEYATVNSSFWLLMDSQVVSSLGYLNKAVLNFFGRCLLVDVSTPLRNGIAVSLWTCMFSFRKNCQMVFQSGWTNLHFH